MVRRLDEGYPLGEFTIPMVETDHYGVLLAPEDFVQLAAVLNQAHLKYGNIEGWRGQADIDWKVESTAVRRIKTYLNQKSKRDGMEVGNLLKFPSLEVRIREYEERLLHAAYLKGYGVKDGRRLSELELLAYLQHNGAATCLLDFTKSAYVALWFGCDDNPKYQDKYGLLLGSDFQAYRDKCVRLRRDSDAHRPIKELINKHKNKVLVWEPVYLFNRMNIQQSFFLFGKSHNGKWGSLMADPFYHSSDPFDTVLFFACAISPELKAHMQARWRSIMGYDIATIFPEVEGFGRHHSSIKMFDYDFFED